MDLLRALAPCRTPGTYGLGDDGAGLHAVAWIFRSVEDLLHRVCSGGRASDAGSHGGGDEVGLSQVERRTIEGTTAAADRLLQGPLQTVAVAKHTASRNEPIDRWHRAQGTMARNKNATRIVRCTIP